MKKLISKESKELIEYPFEIKLLIESGDHYQDAKEFYTAIECYTQAIELNPLNAQAYHKRGWSKAHLGDTQDWNYYKVGSKFIFGVQVAPVKGLKFALNYQGFTSDNAALDTESLVFLNAEFKL